MLLPNELAQNILVWLCQLSAAEAELAVTRSLLLP